jgi:hypothetical protein
MATKNSLYFAPIPFVAALYTYGEKKDGILPGLV